MNVVFKNEDKEQFLVNDGILYFLSPNQSGKTFYLDLIKEGFLGQSKNFLVNNLKPEKNQYNVIYLDDTTDFNEVFKFTKNNLFRELIYSSVLNNINETKILQEVNELFNKIDIKVNRFLDININKKQEEKMRFDINITDVNSIIDKFTNIYIDNYLIKESNIPRSIKRKLIYNLLLFELKKSESRDNIVIIDNFDLYLDAENTKRIITKLQEYRKKNKNTYFFLSTNNNIYDLIDDKKSIYSIRNKKSIRIEKMEDNIEISLLKTYYEKEKTDIPFEQFINDNIVLNKEEIAKKQKEINYNCQHDIGKIYTSNHVKLVTNLETNPEEIIIYCKDAFYLHFYEELLKKFD